MVTPTVYAICDTNCKYETLTREQILAAITQAVNEGTIGDCDTGFIQTIKTINGLPLRFFVGDQSTYDALTDEQKENLYAIITNDGTQDGIAAAIAELQTNYNELYEGLVKGSFVPKNAENATNDKNGNDIASTYVRKDSMGVKQDSIFDEVIKTGFANKVLFGILPSYKKLDDLVGISLEVEWAGSITLTFSYKGVKNAFADDDGNGTCVNFALVSPTIPTANSFEQNQINVSIYLIDNLLYLCFNGGAYSYFYFSTESGTMTTASQYHPLSEGTFTLKGVSYWFA